MKSISKAPPEPSMLEHGGADSDEESLSSEPAHHARRPMNAFLIFCKRHRSVVRERYPHLENRSITKILGEWWAQLDPKEKGCYTELAKQYKEAFLRANPNFKWYKLPAPPLRTLITRPSNHKPLRLECPLTTGPIVPGKLADESQMGSLSSLLSSPPSTPTSPSVPKPPKKRYLEETFSSHQNLGWDDLRIEKLNEAPTNPVEIEKEVIKPGNTSGQGVQFSNAWRQMGARPAETTVQASQQQLIERVVDHICAGRSPEATPPQPSTWSTVSSSQETNNNEMSCMNGNGEEEVKLSPTKSSSDICDKCSEADSGISSREDLAGTEAGAGGNFADEDKSNQAMSSFHLPEGRRKSLRACKGKRYQEFMNAGRLTSGKRSKSQAGFSNEGLEMPSGKRRRDSGSSSASEKTDSAFSEGSRGSRDPEELCSSQTDNFPLIEREQMHIPRKHRRQSETSEESFSDSSHRKRFRAADFNLDEKIDALPSLSLEEFQQKKKAKKKRTISSIGGSPKKNHVIIKQEPKDSFLGEVDGENEEASHSPSKQPLVGSQKRKARKQQITRFDPNTDPTSRDTTVVEAGVLNNLGLATLAEVASVKSKLVK